MADLYYKMDATKTTLIDWFTQSRQRWSIAPDETVLVEARATFAYILHGILILASELRTFNRATELAEQYELDAEFFLWFPYTGDKVVYCRTDDHGNFWAVPDRPIIHKFTGENEALILIYMRLIGTTADYQAGFNMDDLDEATNDWGI